MLGALIIVFREVIEAGLIVGIVMAATRGVPTRGRWIGFGILGGLVGAAVVAIFAGAISQAFEGAGQELFNASVLGIAVVMLMWHNAWMARHGREIAEEMRTIGTAVSEGAKPLTALAVVVGLAVLREGSEVVLFLYGIFASGTSGSALLTGGLLGVAAGAAFTALTYYGLLAIPNRYIFSVTSWLIALLAAGMAAQSVQFLNNAGVVVVFDRTVWDTSWLLSDGSLFGKLLHTLDRLYRAADRNPVDDLYRDAGRHVPADAAGASGAARAGPGGRRIDASAPSSAQSREGRVRRAVDQLEQRARRSARITLALLPIAHGLDRHFDLLGEGGLRQPAARAHLAHERRRIGMIEGLFAAVRHDLDDPPIGLQPHPHHGFPHRW